MVQSADLIFTNSKGAFDKPLAEFCLGSMLYFSRNYERLTSQKNNKKFTIFPIETLEHKNLVILGYGSIGQEVAKHAKPFGLKITGIRRQPSENDLYTDEILGIDSLPIVLPQTDYLVMALPDHSSTRNAIGKDLIEIMKSSSVIINVGRGINLDETAIAEALYNGKIKGAALDAFKTEPLPEDSTL